MRSTPRTERAVKDVATPAAEAARAGQAGTAARPSTSAADPGPASSDSSKAASSHTTKFREMVTKYGGPFVLYWLMAYGTSMLGFYCVLEFLGVDGHILLNSWMELAKEHGFDTERVMAMVGLEHREEDEWSKEFMNVLLAWQMTEFTDLVRVPLLVFTMPAFLRGYTAAVTRMRAARKAYAHFQMLARWL